MRASLWLGGRNVIAVVLGHFVVVEFSHQNIESLVVLTQLAVQDRLLVVEICVRDVLQQEVGVEVFGGENEPAEVLTPGLTVRRELHLADESKSQLRVMSLHLTLLLKDQELQKTDLGSRIFAEDVQSVVNKLRIFLNTELRLHEELGSQVLIKTKRMIILIRLAIIARRW